MTISVSLGEGSTPLVKSVHIGPALGVRNLFFKLENCNPSGSYKDRFVAAEVTRILRVGARACVATSSGNTGSSLAPYCSRYGIGCAIVVGERTPTSKLEQMQAHGAHVFRVRNFITSADITTQVLNCLSKLAIERALPLVISAYRYCPEGMAGVETIAHELQSALTTSFSHVFVPVGGGGLYSAVCRGFEREGCRGPRIHAVQPNGCSTLVASFERGDSDIRPVQSTTRISGLAVPFDIDASLALECLRRCQGTGFGVEDDEVFAAQRLMLGTEGIYCEPAGAAAVAGVRRAVASGLVDHDDTIVCLVTGHGFKDPESIHNIALQHAMPQMDADQLESNLLGII